MELDEIMALLKANTAVTPRRFYKYVAEKKTGACAKCLRLAGEIFSKNDPNIPQLPLHPNCNCKLIEVDQAEYQKQQEQNPKNDETQKVNNITAQDKEHVVKANLANATSSVIMADYMKYYHML